MSSTCLMNAAVAMRRPVATQRLQRLSRRAATGAFLFFLVKGLLWLVGPAVILLAR